MLVKLTPWVFSESEFCVWPETVVGFVSQGCPVDKYVVEGRWNIEIVFTVEAQQVFVHILAIIDGHVVVVQNLKCKIMHVADNLDYESLNSNGKRPVGYQPATENVGKG